MSLGKRRNIGTWERNLMISRQLWFLWLSDALASWWRLRSFDSASPGLRFGGWRAVSSREQQIHSPQPPWFRTGRTGSAWSRARCSEESHARDDGRHGVGSQGPLWGGV